MTTRTVTLRMPPDLLRSAEALAAERDVTVGQILRDLLRAELAAHNELGPHDPLAEVVVHPVRARLEADVKAAASWDDLQRRLRAKGFAMREAGGGLAVHEWPGGRRVCKASEIGHGYAALMRRFGEPFPGHRQRALAERVLGRTGTWEDDDPLLEPF